MPLTVKPLHQPDLPTIEGGFQLIYADPPWRFKPWSDKGSNRQPDGPEGAFHYNTMTLEQIKTLMVQNIAAQDSVLVLWVIDSMLPEALDVMAAWGFDFRTVALTWTKEKPSGAEHISGGYYTRSNPEQALLGVRGHGLTRASASVRQWIHAPVTRHSQKPVEAAYRLEQLFGDVSRLEMFARTTRAGWSSWGNEVPA